MMKQSKMAHDSKIVRAKENLMLSHGGPSYSATCSYLLSEYSDIYLHHILLCTAAYNLSYEQSQKRHQNNLLVCEYCKMFKKLQTVYQC